MQREYGTAGGRRLLFTSLTIFILIPAVIAGGVFLLRDRRYNLISILVALLACLPFFLSFERRRPQARELVVIAVMAAVSTAGRVLFAFVPGFKPVTALTVITGAALGPEAGFLTGAVTAVVSNLFFGQGPWTPFQMLIWGLIGYFAGWLGRAGLMERGLVQALYGVLSGVAFSLAMDIWTVLTLDNAFRLSRYLAVAAASLPFMAMYAVSNVIFLLLLGGPIGRKLARLRTKYGIGAGTTG